MKARLLFFLIAFLLSACTATSAAITMTPSYSPPPTATITPTIIWFPPTQTNTPFPTPIITPTEDLRPQIGAILLEDDFSDQNAWTLTHSEAGNIGFGKNELTIAIGESNAYLFSIRAEPVFTDFYLEIIAEPNLCRNVDEYGVLFRVSPNIDYYRFSLSCDGQVRLDRVYSGKASSPQPWLLSGAVPPGAPSSSRLGISAIGSEFEFFVNDRFQFSVHDPLLASGGIGVFARSTNKMAVTVNFSNLTIYDVNP